MAQQIFTAQDARREKRDAGLAREIKAYAAQVEKDRIESILQANPAIGELCRRGKRVFYTFEGGYRESNNPADLAG